MFVTNILIPPQYKAFVCDEPGATWYKDCKDPTDGLQVEGKKCGEIYKS